MSTIDSPGPALPTAWARELSCVPFGRPSVSLYSQGNCNECGRTHASNVLCRKSFQGSRGMPTTGGTGFLERATGIEPVSEAWEALNKTLKEIELAALSFPSDSLNWKLDGN